MVRIKSLKLKGRNKYVWLKYVRGADLKFHCAKSLLGEYSTKLNNIDTEYTNIELDEFETEYYYFCCVSQPYNWHRNIHLAFKEQEGSSIVIDNNLYSIEVENAVEVPFSISDVNLMLPQARKREFNTCRNWQFANKIHKLKEIEERDIELRGF